MQRHQVNGPHHFVKSLHFCGDFGWALPLQIEISNNTSVGSKKKELSVDQEYLLSSTCLNIKYTLVYSPSVIGIGLSSTQEPFLTTDSQPRPITFVLLNLRWDLFSPQCYLVLLNMPFPSQQAMNTTNYKTAAGVFSCSELWAIPRMILCVAV